jgi:predicted RNase H-like HicB family nuclease
LASQGKTRGEPLKNFQEVFELWFESAEDGEKERAIKGDLATMVLELEV